MISLSFEDTTILSYLLEKTFKEGENPVVIIKNVLDFFDDKQEKCLMTFNFFSVFLPYLSKILVQNKYKQFWREAVIKLEELHKSEESKCIDDAFYNKWIDFYKNLAK